MIIYDSSNNAVLSSNKIRQQNIEKCCKLFSAKFFFSINKGYVRKYHNCLFRNWRRQAFLKRMNYTIEIISHVLPWLSCHDLAMILL